jgi:hypothetical protein
MKRQTSMYPPKAINSIIKNLNASEEEEFSNKFKNNDKNDQ